MSILRTSKNKLRSFAAFLAVLALMTLSLGSAMAHHAAGTGSDNAPLTLSITSLTDNGDVDEDADENEAEPPDATDDNGDVDEDSVDENDQGEDDNSADENDQGQDEQADENDDNDDQDEADDGDGSGGGDENDDDDGGEGGDD